MRPERRDTTAELLLRNAGDVRLRSSLTRTAADAAIRRSLDLQARLRELAESLRPAGAHELTIDAPAAVVAEPAPLVEDAPPEPVPARVANRRPRRRSAHFALASITVDGRPLPVSYAGLDVYHAGPDFDDAGAATWEVQCTRAPDTESLQVRHEYELLIETKDGRRFSGRAFAQHVSREVCTLLDTGEPLDGLLPGDLVE